MKKLPDPILVTEAAQFNTMVSALRSEKRIAVDTESNSLFAYRERVCLIQFSTSNQDYLVDPLALEDISSLGEIFSNKEIEKVFHAAEYDLLVMKRDFGFSFANIFDTMVAARILGREKVGLGSLLEIEFGVRVQKKFQRANWGRRPIPADMLNYARLDTHYLIKLREILFKELQKIKRWVIAQEDFSRLEQVNGNGPTPQPANIWRMNGVRDLSPEQATILKHLAKYRQKQAEKLNIPMFKIIGDKTLVEIAALQPSTFKELGKVAGMTAKQQNRHGKAILSAVIKGLNDKPSFRPRRPRMPDDIADRLEALKTWRRDTARNFGLESDVILPKDIMFDIAHSGPADKNQLTSLMKGIPWRFERFGEAIYSVLKETG